MLDLNQIIVELNKENMELKAKIEKIKKTYRKNVEKLYDELLYDVVIRNKEDLKYYGYNNEKEIREKFINGMVNID